MLSGSCPGQGAVQKTAFIDRAEGPLLSAVEQIAHLAVDFNPTGRGTGLAMHQFASSHPTPRYDHQTTTKPPSLASCHRLLLITTGPAQSEGTPALARVCQAIACPFRFMRDHPISPVTEPLQYRAIGVVRGTYKPESDDQLTRGSWWMTKAKKWRRWC